MTLERPVRDAVAPRVGTRLGLMDSARLLAAAGIVWVHVSSTETGDSLYPNLYPLGTFGVPFYLFIAMLFMARSMTREPYISVAQYFRTRLARVCLPFLGWTAIYVLLAQVKYILQDGQIYTPPLSVLYAGGHQHLWFLPFLMILTMLGAVLVRGLQHRDVLRTHVAALLIAVGIGLCFLPEPRWISTRESFGDLEFWRCVFRALPTACWATAIALLFASRGSLPRTTKAIAFGGAVLLLGSLIGMSLTEPFRALRGLAGLGMLLIALWPARTGAIERVSFLGRYSYGVYLSHVVFVRIFVLWMERFGIEPDATLIVLEFVVVFAASLGLSVLFDQSRYTRWLLGN